MPRSSDDRLMNAAMRLIEDRNDHSAWNDIYTILWPYVAAIVFRSLSGHPALVNDVAQDVFVRLFRYCPFEDLQDAGAVRAYAARVARNECLRALPRASAIALHEEPADPSSYWTDQHPADADPGLRDLETSWLIASMSEALTEDEMRLVTLLAAELSLAAIAADLDVSYSAAASKVWRLRKKLARVIFEMDAKN